METQGMASYDNCERKGSNGGWESDQTNIGHGNFVEISPNYQLKSE